MGQILSAGAILRAGATLIADTYWIAGIAGNITEAFRQYTLVVYRIKIRR
jgi:hypothetical protein